MTESAIDPVPGQRRSAEHDPADDAVRQAAALRRRLLDDLSQQLRAGLRRARDLPPSERPQAEALARLTAEQPEAPSYSANDDKHRLLQPDVLLVGTARGKEIIFDTLSPARKAAIREAMAKEWSRWQQLEATIPVSADKLQELPDDLQIVGTRWVLTEKANGTAKARLVVQGCQEKTSDIRSDSPTGSRDYLMLTLIHAAQRGWSVSQYDADCAYLQSEGINRTLVLRMPRKQPSLDKNQEHWRSRPAPSTARRTQVGIGTCTSGSISSKQASSNPGWGRAPTASTSTESSCA